MDQLVLVQRLSALTPGHLAQLVAAIPDAAMHLSRHGTVPEHVAELVRWAESPTGVGLAELQRVVASLFPQVVSDQPPVDASGLIFQVPHGRNPYFTGREGVLRELRERLVGGGRAALAQAIRGLGGVGKTQTAAEYAHRYAGEYRAVLWVRAETEADLTGGFLELARVLRLPHDETKADEAVRAVRAWLETNAGWLLVCDNADRPERLRPFLPPRHAGHVLLTSRAQDFDMLGIPRPVELPPLPLPDAVRFLLERTGRGRGDAAEEEAAQWIAGELGGLPLALEQAGAYMRHKRVGFARYREAFERRRLELLQRHRPATGEYPESVATTWALNFAEVAGESTAAAELLRLSAFLSPDAIPLELLTRGAAELGDTIGTALSDDPLLGAHELLAVPARYSLVEVDQAAEAYSVHRLVQEVVRDGLTPDERRAWADTAVRAVDAAFPSVEPEDWPLCGRLLPQAQAAARLIGDYGLRGEAGGRLLNQAGYYLHEQGRYAEAEPLLRQALEVVREVLGERHPDFALSLNNLAYLYRAQGRLSEAEPLFRQALALRREVLGERHPDFALSLNNLAYLYEPQGRYAEAEPLFRRALELRREVLGERHPQYATSLNNLAYLYETQGKLSEAEPLFRQALEIAWEELGERHPQYATSLNNLASHYQSQGKLSEAEPLLRRALELRREVLGERHPDYAASLNNLAGLFYAQGKLSEAEPLFRQALEIGREALGESHPTCMIFKCNLDALLARQRAADSTNP